KEPAETSDVNGPGRRRQGRGCFPAGNDGKWFYRRERIGKVPAAFSIGRATSWALRLLPSAFSAALPVETALRGNERLRRGSLPSPVPCRYSTSAARKECRPVWYRRASCAADRAPTCPACSNHRGRPRMASPVEPPPAGDLKPDTRRRPR